MIFVSESKLELVDGVTDVEGEGFVPFRVQIVVFPRRFSCVMTGEDGRMGERGRTGGRGGWENGGERENGKVREGEEDGRMGKRSKGG